jgi:hypothetical protein
MAEEGGGNRGKRKHYEIAMEKKLKSIEDKQDSLVFAVGKMFQVVLKSHQALEESKGSIDAQGDEKKGNPKYALNSMFTKTKSKTALTRAHVYVKMMCGNIYPTDVELCNEFLEQRESLEAKEVKKWWNLNRHKIIKYFFIFNRIYHYH